MTDTFERPDDTREFVDHVTVTPIRIAADDADVIASARVSTQGTRSLESLTKDPEEAAGLIRFLMKNRHGTPFEHNSFTFLVEAPIFVFREFHRHRIGWGYNEESGRYKQLNPKFYIPSAERNLVQVGKPGAYTMEPGTQDQYHAACAIIAYADGTAYSAYEKLLELGVAKEIARSVLPVNIFSSMYATCNARSLMSFLSLRTDRPEAAYPSKPQREIEMVAEQMEAHFALAMPITYEAFVDFGRVSP